MGEAPSGENDRLYFLLTRNLGFVAAQAAGVRLLKSKLRHHLTLFALVEAELIRGKNFWRMVSVSPAEETIFFRNKNTPVFARLTGLIRRLVHGEEENEKLFEDLKKSRALISENGLSEEEITVLETISAARILSALGYLSEEKYPEIFHGEINKSVISGDRTILPALVKDINLALQESHL